MTGGADEIAGIASVSLTVGFPANGLFDVTVWTVPTGRKAPAPALGTVNRGPDPGHKGAVDVETDGESAGVLPATFEIYPVTINLRA